jgi:ketosteroid isomerase-like protein
MAPSRRSFLAAAGASITSGMAAAAFANNEDVVTELIKHSEMSNAALMRGEIETYLSLMSFTDDFTLMSPFGGAPTHYAQLTKASLEALGRFFKNGSLSQEVVQAYGSQDMVVLAVIERARVEVGGLPLQDWSLRVTLVYRREGTSWRLAHRHADPLVAGISLAQAAALAREPA